MIIVNAAFPSGLCHYHARKSFPCTTIEDGYSGMKFRIKQVDELYLNKGVVQCTDLRFSFRICKKQF